MASKATLLLAFTLLFATCIARHQQRQQQQNQCQLQNIEALEPIEVIQAEAGVTEIWDAYDQQFQCAGVDFIRHRIQPGGLLLPSCWISKFQNTKIHKDKLTNRKLILLLQTHTFIHCNTKHIYTHLATYK
ncbi:putative rmlC-like cupin domain superfamily, rmlC-like jelly roll protein [Helianthus annuus]|uniref:RmlC-like cupin domain superfamily, rmlC-like jelly roll protein n=1 Tax=Helianthus annuus TaxID=4232 RepID=A0A9K3HZ26_HELAN|nr:putative rmlC-like cupin domain superfamily, rmlC-like jelly roll protein [Helianthus annuus]